MQRFYRKLNLLACLITVSALTFGTVSASAKESTLPADSASVSVETEVKDSIENSGEAKVVISLKGFDVSDLASSSSRNELKGDQNAVLENADLNSSETKKFSRVPVITSTIDLQQLEELKSDPNVESIKLSKYYSPQELKSAAPAVKTVRPALSDAVVLLDANDAWNNSTSYTGSGKTVVVIDTGVDSSHAFLDGAVVTERCYAEGPNGPGGAGSCPNGLDTQTGTGAAAPCTGTSSCGHGTHVAGIAAGRTNVVGAPSGASGVAPAANILAIQVFSKFTNADLYQGNPFCTALGSASPCILTNDTDVLSALEYVLANTTNVASVNMSLGGPSEYSQTCDFETPDVTDAISTLRNTYGILTAIAAGNDGDSANISWPACISTAVVVGASSKTDTLGLDSYGDPYSNSNSLLDVWAPGGSSTSQGAIRSSVPVSLDTDGTADGYGLKIGTSMASPMIAGAIAVLREAYPSENANQILYRLQNSGVSITDSRNGVTKRRPSVFGAISLPVPPAAAPAAPASATLVAGLGYGTLTWSDSDFATSYKIYDINGALVDTVSDPITTATVPTSRNMPARFTVTALNVMGTSSARVSNTVVGLSSKTTDGYALFATNGSIKGYGSSSVFTRSATSPATPVIGGSSNPNETGGWTVTSNGVVAAYGDAQLYGDARTHARSKPIKGIVSTPTGKGYWLLGSEGTVLIYGDARYYGNARGSRSQNLVGLVPSPTGNGYLLLGNDGGILKYGDARYYGNARGNRSGSPAAGIVGTSTGNGYLIVGRDGGILKYGDAKYFGDARTLRGTKAVVGLRVKQNGNGYWIIANNGDVYPFSATNFGSGAGAGLSFMGVA